MLRIMFHIFNLLYLVGISVSNAIYPSDKCDHGTNIHFTNPPNGSLSQMNASFKVIRTNVRWASVERHPSIYDFSSYDILIQSLISSSLQPLLILSYGNPLYTNGSGPIYNAPVTPSAIQAFTNYAIATIYRYRNLNIIWELWNEANHGTFWQPVANATQYVNLAKSVSNAMRQNSSISDEILIGPACGKIDLQFLESIMQMGVLSYFDGISVHPYRDTNPETVLPEYEQLAELMKKYNDNEYKPILESEWGYPTCSDATSGEPIQCVNGFAGIYTEITQAQYLVRQWFINNIFGIPLSIFYEYKNNGDNTTYSQDNFGVCLADYRNESVPFVPKLSYYTAVTYQKYFGGYGLHQFYRISIANITCNCNKTNLFVVNVNEYERMSVWYSIPQNKTIIVQNVSVTATVTMNMKNETCFAMTDMFGNKMESVCTTNNGQQIQLNNVSQSPLYFDRLS